MTKSVKAVVIAAAALLVLGGALMILLLTKPASENEGSGEASVSDASSKLPDAYIVDRDGSEVVTLSVSNSGGTYTLERDKRTVTSTDESGNVSSKQEYFWTCPQLLNVKHDDAKIRGFVNSLARFIENSAVEENAEDLEKYGLKEPTAEATLIFEDGEELKMQFGIVSPTDSSSVYFRSNDGNKVSLVNYYAMQPALSDARQFAELVLTETYNTDASNEIEDMRIIRKDLDEPIELRYMKELENVEEDDDYLISTFNMHRFITPVSAEIDVTKGKAITQGIYSLTMSSCLYLEKTEENLRKCGLDDPQTTVEFRFGGKEHTLLIGNEIRDEQSSGDESVSFADLLGYYAVLSDTEGIFMLAAGSAPWVTVQAADIISRRPVSPYIYSVDSVDIKTPDGEYNFKIDSENKSFSCNGNEVDDTEFRSFYQTLIGSIGEEMFTGEAKGEPVVSITFNYKDKFTGIYGTKSDTVSYFEDDGRKNVIQINGKTLFKIRTVYTERLFENINALQSGGKVQVDW